MAGAENLVAAYRFRRANLAPLHVSHAKTSLILAREDVARGVKRYASAPDKFGQFARLAGSYSKRFYEQIDGSPFRLVGFADEVLSDHGVRIDHTGWFSDTDQQEKLRGVVLQIPGQGGAPRFMAAYQESVSGGYIVEFGGRAIARGEKGRGYSDARDHRGAREAALWADRFAENAAEESREWAEAWQAGQNYSDILAEMRSTARDAVAMISELRSIHKPAPGIVTRLNRLFEAAKVRLRENAEERETLKTECPRELESAFNEGAGEEVFHLAA